MSHFLRHPPSKIIRQLLVDYDLCTDPDDGVGPWPCYVGFLADKPDSALAIYDTQGPIQGRTHTDGEVQGPFGLQVKVRSDDNGDGYLKAKNVLRCFDEFVLRDTVVIGTTSYLVQAITRTSDVISMGAEAPTSRRRLFSANAVATITLLVDGETGTGT